MCALIRTIRLYPLPFYPSTKPGERGVKCLYIPGRPAWRVFNIWGNILVSVWVLLGQGSWLIVAPHSGVPCGVGTPVRVSSVGGGIGPEVGARSRCPGGILRHVGGSWRAETGKGWLKAGQS